MLVWAGLLLLLPLCLYFPILGHGFVHWDDDQYVFRNPMVLGGLNWPAVRWAFTAFHAGTWQPVTWLSYLLDATVYGDAPAGYHGTSLTLHAINTLLLFGLLVRLTGALGRSAFVSAVFSVHPQGVEAVAWIAARKDLLSTFFLLASVWSYLRWVRRPGAARQFLLLGSFALGLMSKPMAMSLPVLLLLLDRWPLKRLGISPEHKRIRSLVLEKWPLFALSLGSLVATYLAQARVGAVSPLGEISLGMRLANAAFSYVMYLVRAVWPAKLACFYPYAKIATHTALGSAGLLAIVTFLAVRVRRSRPYVLTGWLWYLIALVPVIGFVQIGSHARADRFTYLPMIGIYGVIAWGVVRVVRDIIATPMSKAQGSTASRLTPGAASGILGVVSTATVAVLVVLGSRQIRTWKDDVALFGHAVRVTEANYLAHNKLGASLVLRGDPASGWAHIRDSVRINPNYVDGLYNLAALTDRQGKPEEAIPYFQRALVLAPHDQRIPRGLANAYSNLGVDQAQAGRWEDALRSFRQAIRCQPNHADAYFNLARALSTRGDREGARRALEGGIRAGGIVPPDLESIRR